MSTSRHYDIKECPTSKNVVEKLKTNHGDRSAIFHRMKASECSEPKTRFEHDTGLIQQLPNQPMPQNIPAVTSLKAYRIGNQAKLKQNQSRLLKVEFKSPNERDLISQNGLKLKGSGVSDRKDLSLAGRVKEREAEGLLQLRLGAVE